jgi:hypothetical protein
MVLRLAVWEVARKQGKGFTRKALSCTNSSCILWSGGADASTFEEWPIWTELGWAELSYEELTYQDGDQ